MTSFGLTLAAFVCCLVLVFWLTGREIDQWANKEGDE